MKKVTKYKDHTGIAITAMMESAQKDDYTDQIQPMEPLHAPLQRPKITNLRDWRNMRKKYKDSMEGAVEAMMASANKEYLQKKKH